MGRKAIRSPWQLLCRPRCLAGAGGAAAVLGVLRHVQLAQLELDGGSRGVLPAAAPPPLPATVALPRPAVPLLGKSAPASSAAAVGEFPRVAAAAATATAADAGLVTVSQDGAGPEIWVYCGGESMYCTCPGRIRWGNGNVWKEFPPQEKTRRCNNEEMGPVKVGDGKHCECSVQPGTEFYRRHISPGAVPPGAPEPEAPLAISCEVLEAGKNSGAWGHEQWRAMEGICNSARPDGPPGPRTLNDEQMRHLFNVWIDPLSVENYKRLYDVDGWLEEAFVNFVGSAPPDGRYAKMNYELIRSVHLFSTRPVLVVHFGMAAPPSWDPAEFPRLVVLHAAPLPSLPKRRFCFNKYRAMLVARVRTGIQLDSDQFVAPGVDALFARAAQESSQDYPMPILPVHFLRNEELPMWPKDEQRYKKSPIFNSRFCPASASDKFAMNCSGVTVRWGHAHPTWTFWALPWLGRWLRRHLRDETLAALEGEPGTALRVGDIPEDEALLNVGTWNDLGHKQWCKYDNTDPADFYRLFRANQSTTCGEPKANIVKDARYHPAGAAMVFYTAHHAVDPSVSKKMIDTLRQRHASGTLAKPIYYNGCFFADGKALHEAFPGVKCII